MRLLVVSRRAPEPGQWGRSAAFGRLAERLATVTTLRRVLGYVGDRNRLPPDTLGVDLEGRSRVGESFALWRAIREEVHRFRPDVVVSDGLDLPPIRVPAIAVVRDLVGTGWDAVMGPRWWRVHARRSRIVVVPHDVVRRDLQRAGVDPHRVSVVPELVDTGTPAQREAGAPFTLLHPGAVHPAKGQHFSIDLVSRLPLELKGRVRLVIAGPAPNPRYLAQLRVAASDQPVVFVTDPAEVALWRQRADLVLYPTSLDEGCPDAALSALGQGLVVVAPDRATLRDQLGAGALLLPPGQISSWRDAVARAVGGGLELAKLGEQGRALVSSRHGWEQIWPRWRMLLAAVSR